VILRSLAILVHWATSPPFFHLHFSFTKEEEEEKTSMSISQGPCHDICINFHLVLNYNYTSDYTTYKMYNKQYYLKKKH